MPSGRKVELCGDYWTEEGCIKEECSSSGCSKLHLCRYFLQTFCRSNDSCKFSHSVGDGHNAMVFDEAGMTGITIQQLKYAYKKVQSARKPLPEACKFYNGMKHGCKHSDDDKSGCHCLHICKYFILGDCKFGNRCKSSHNLTDQQPAKILRHYNINIFNSNKEGIIAELRNFYLVQQEQSLMIDFDHPFLCGEENVPHGSELEDGEIVESNNRAQCCNPVPWMPFIGDVPYPIGPGPFGERLMLPDMSTMPPNLTLPPFFRKPPFGIHVADPPLISNGESSANPEIVPQPSTEEMIQMNLSKERSIAENMFTLQSNDRQNDLGCEGKLTDTDYRQMNVNDFCPKNISGELEQYPQRFGPPDGDANRFGTPDGDIGLSPRHGSSRQSKDDRQSRYSCDHSPYRRHENRHNPRDEKTNFRRSPDARDISFSPRRARRFSASHQGKDGRESQYQSPYDRTSPPRRHQNRHNSLLEKPNFGRSPDGEDICLIPRRERRFSPSCQSEGGRERQSHSNYSPYRRNSPFGRSQLRHSPLREKTNFRRSPSYNRHWHDNNRQSPSRGLQHSPHYANRYEEGKAIGRSDDQYRNAKRDATSSEVHRRVIKRSAYGHERLNEGHRRENEQRSNYHRRSHNRGSPFNEEDNRNSFETPDYSRAGYKYKMGRNASSARMRAKRGRY